MIILNSNPIPVRIERNIAQFCFAKSNIEIAVFVVDRGRKAESQLPSECVQAKHGKPCLSFTSNPHNLLYGVVQDMTSSTHKHGNLKLHCYSSFGLQCPLKMASLPLWKAYMRSAPSHSSLAKAAPERVPTLVWLNADRSQPRRVKRRPHPFSTPLSFR